MIIKIETVSNGVIIENAKGQKSVHHSIEATLQDLLEEMGQDLDKTLAELYKKRKDKIDAILAKPE